MEIEPTYIDLEYIEEYIWMKVDELLEEDSEGEIFCFYNLNDADLVTSFNVDYDGETLLLEEEDENSSRTIQMIAHDDVPEMLLVLHHSLYVNLFKVINMEFIGEAEVEEE